MFTIGRKRVWRDVDSEVASRDCIAHVADSLGNMKAISRDDYIHPAIIRAHVGGTLQTIYDQACARQDAQSTVDKNGLAPEEITLMELIEQSAGTR